jgi:cardiolipin synthase
MTDHPYTHFTQKALQHAHSYGTQFVDGNMVTLLWKGTESFQTIFKRIQGAKEIICLEFYIFRDDETGNELAEILKKKAAEGVEVNILYDHFGSLLTPGSFWKRLRDSGVRIRASRPFKWESPFEYVYRDHKKLIVIDGRYAFTGGLNIANEYRGVPMMKRKEAWRDTGILLEGPIAAALLDIFKKSWKLWRGDHIGFQRHIDPIPGGLPVLPIFASSAKGRRKMRKLLYFSLNTAEKSIYLTTAYFTPSRRMQQVLAQAVARGVDVKILLPGRSDMLAAHYAGRACFKRMLNAGVEIHAYQGDILHAKSAVFDGIWSVIGSANLDFQSLRRNDEGNVGIIDRAFGSQMTELFFRDLGNSALITPEKWRIRPFTEKIKENFFALFRRRL